MSFLKWNKDSIERDSRLLLPGMTIGSLSRDDVKETDRLNDQSLISRSV